MSSTNTRPTAVAGMFYPGTADTLTRDVDALLADAADAVPPVPQKGFPSVTPTFAAPKALIVPHAGYIYSGPIAASAYAQLATHADRIERVVLLGPSHRVPLRGLGVPHATAFETPLGSIPLDTAAIAAALRLARVSYHDAAHADEHALEVQLPFLQRILGKFHLIPFAVGYATPDEVADVLELLWGGPETLVVVSSDLSHYHPYTDAQRRDRATADDILHLRLLLDNDKACGAAPINGLIEVAQRRGLRPLLLDLRNSGDTAGDKSRVVGYASFAFVEPGHA